MHEVVASEDCDVFTTCSTDRFPVVFCDAEIDLVTHVRDSLVIELLEILAYRIVRIAVVKYRHRPVSPRLGTHGLDGLEQQVGLAPEWDKDLRYHRFTPSAGRLFRPGFPTKCWLTTPQILRDLLLTLPARFSAQTTAAWSPPRTPMPQGTIGVMKISPRLLKLIVTIATPLLLLLTFASWSLSSAVGSSPDDNFHLASIWCGLGDRD